MVAMACRLLGTEPRLSVVSPLLMRLVGLFVPDAGASVEMMYEFTGPFVVDSRRIQSAFGLEPTPVASGIARTVSWYGKHAKNG